MKKAALFLLVVAIVLSSLCLTASADSLAERYEAAGVLMADGKLNEAANAFDALRGYSDATNMAIYCRAIDAGEKGQYDKAADTFQQLGNFRDSINLRAYYIGRSWQDGSMLTSLSDASDPDLESAKSNLNRAIEIYEKLGLFRDCEKRITACYATIANIETEQASRKEAELAAQKALAEAELAAKKASYEDGIAKRAEENWAGAIEAFRKADDYSDAKKQLKECQAALEALQKLQAAYDKADALEKSGSIISAYRSFLQLGDYSDSKSRAEALLPQAQAIQYAQAEADEKEEDYESAYNGFVALGEYQNSAARAEAIRLPGLYQSASRHAGNGNFAAAREIWSSLGDYRDSERKAYILSVLDFADQVTDLGNSRASYQWHGVWGLFNLNENTITSSKWTKVGTYDDNGLIRIYANNKVGLANERGETITEPQWIRLGTFDTQGLAIIESSRGYGYIDTAGTVRIDPQWASVAKPDADGYVRVSTKTGLIGYMDMQNKVVMKPKWKSLSARNKSGVMKAESTDGLFGYVDINGNAVVPVIYAELRNSDQDGRFAAKLPNGLWGMLEANGSTLIPCEYTAVSNFKEGYTVLVKPGEINQYFFGLANTKGIITIPCEYKTLGDSSITEKNAKINISISVPSAKKPFWAQKADQTWVLLSADKGIISDAWLEVGKTAEGMTAVRGSLGWGFIDQTGAVTVEPVWKKVSDFSEGLAAVQRGSSIGFVNTKGELVVDTAFTEVTPFQNGVADVKLADNSWSRIASDGTKSYFLTPQFTEAEALMANGDYAAAEAAFGRIVGEPIATIRLQEAKYLQATSLAESGQRAEAIEAFKQLEGYRDSDRYILSLRVATANELENKWHEDESNAEALSSAIAAWAEAADMLTPGHPEGWSSPTHVASGVYMSETEKAYATYHLGMLKLAQHDLDGATKAFTRAAGYGDTMERAYATRYAEAEAKRAAGDYLGAVSMFTELGEYRDAPTQVLATRYAEGEAKRSQRDWDGAVAAFKQAGEYSDAAMQIQEVLYLQANALMEKGDYASAYEAFQTIIGYKDVDYLLTTDNHLLEYAKEAKLKPYKTVGSYVAFGTYPQTSDGKDKTPIEWLVLDVQGNQALLISRYGLDAKPYNEKRIDITWKKCTLRTWLNGTFLSNAFTAEERNGILLTNVDNSSSQGYSKWNTSGGNSTQDKVFLLSYAEANKYLGVTYENKKSTKSRVTPTAYALKQGAYTSSSNKTADGLAAGWWWLRSPSTNQSSAAYVSSGSSLSGSNVDDGTGCVRPAIWLDLTAGIFTE